MFNGNGPTSQFPWIRYQQSMIEEGFSFMQRLARVPSLYQRSQRVKKGATPHEIVYEIDRIKLLHYKSDQPVRYKTPLIFVFALVNRPYILDLKDGKSVVQHFLNRGFDTYLIDWGVPTNADRHLTLDDHINGYLDDIVDFVRERSGSPKVNLLGYCMGGTMSAIYTSLHQEKVNTLTLLAAGIDFATRDGLLNVWNDKRYFDVDKFVDTLGNCPPQFLQTMFQFLKPVQNLIEKPLNFFEKLDDEAFIDDFFAMEGWLNDNIPVPGETFREYVKYLYQQNLLTRGAMPVGKHVIDLKNIKCPVLNLMASKDDLVPPAQSLPFNDLVSSADRKAVNFPAGHIGLAVGGKAQRELWPMAAEWMGERSTNVTGQQARRATASRKAA